MVDQNYLKRIVIIGGGFAGAFAAKYLRKASPDVEVVLFNNTNYFVFQPLLPEVASGIIHATDAVTPLRVMLPDVKVYMADVLEVDTQKQRIGYVQGRKRTLLYLEYDQLIIATGLKAHLSFLPGVAEHSLTLKNLADAFALRNHIIQRLENADITKDPQVKKRLLTFVVAGGGFSGVEMAGEIAGLFKQALQYYPNIQPEEIRGLLVHRGERLLPELSAKLGEYAAQALTRQGVEVCLQTSIESATATAVYLSGEQRIETSTLVATVGHGQTELVASLPVELMKGRLVVDRELRVKNLESVWSIGDAALIALNDTGDAFAPTTAQYALQEARCLARNIAAVYNGEKLKKFSYKPRGALASIGSHKAVAEIYGRRLSGTLAWLLWRGFYIALLPGIATKIRVLFDLLLDYFLPRNIVQISNHVAASCFYARYAKGDILFRPGKRLNGIYIVISGKLQENSDGGTRIINPGEYWGAEIIQSDNTTHSTLIALDDTQVMVLPSKDFESLTHAIPSLGRIIR